MKIIVDNCIVVKRKYGIQILSIKLAQKQNPNLNINEIQMFTTGNKINDHRIIQDLSDGIISFDELIDRFQDQMQE